MKQSRLAALAFSIATLHVLGAALLLTASFSPHYDPANTYLVVNHPEADLQVIFPFTSEADCSSFAGPANGTCLKGAAAKKLFSDKSSVAQLGVASIKQS
jgi:hypothetical protein